MVACAACAAMLLVGCSRPLKQRLEGKWQQSGGGMSMSFLKDGSFIWAQGPLQASGTYTTPDEQHVKIEISGIIGSFIGSGVYEAAVKDEQLTLTVGNEPQQFTRVKD
jgi:hypothetical protein